MGWVAISLQESHNFPEGVHREMRRAILCSLANRRGLGHRWCKGGKPGRAAPVGPASWGHCDGTWGLSGLAEHFPAQGMFSVTKSRSVLDVLGVGPKTAPIPLAPHDMCK